MCAQPKAFYIQDNTAVIISIESPCMERAYSIFRVFLTCISYSADVLKTMFTVYSLAVRLQCCQKSAN